MVLEVIPTLLRVSTTLKKGPIITPTEPTMLAGPANTLFAAEVTYIPPDAQRPSI